MKVNKELRSVIQSDDFSSLDKRKIAIIHDALVVQSGSERFTLMLSDIIPNAPIYTAAYLPYNTYPEFKHKNIITLPLSRHVKSEKQFKGMFPWWYLGFSTLDLSQYEIVISSANYLAKYINPPKNTVHICYLHNPFRFLWKPNVYSENSVPYNNTIVRAIKLFFPVLKKIDIAKTKKIKHIITNSHNIARQIQTIYGIPSAVIYPPVRVNEFSIADEIDDYYLYVGRLISHKRVDLAIKACSKLNRRLLIVGDGLERSRLEKFASNFIQFMGRVPEDLLKSIYSRCRALIFPSDEDFGLVPVEAQASGRPVIAYQSGGSLETIIENETGIFFSEQSVDSLCDAILKFEGRSFSPSKIRENAQRFDIAVFQHNILQYINQFD
jgi:glycosyltransferase involved in cell wall biosynthesis